MLSQLRVRGFRNLADLEWCPEAGSQLLLGGNGAGKTSLLEAVYLVATTRSFRTSRLRDCLAMGLQETKEGSFEVSATVEARVRARLCLRWSAQEGLARERDAKAATLAEYLDPLPVVVWSSRETEVLSGAPEQRRRMIDSGLVSSDPARLRDVTRYRRCLDQKKELLRRGHAGLEEWNRLTAEAAAALCHLRAQWVEDLQRQLTLAQEQSGLPFPALALEYQPSPAAALDGSDAIFAAMEEVRDEERRTRRCIVGPHRDRLGILWGSNEVAEVASAGERKAFGLLLMAAQASLLEAGGRAPLLLADDVDTELDGTTFAALWTVLEGRGQLVASSNRPAIWESLEVDRTWPVERGEIRS